MTFFIRVLVGMRVAAMLSFTTLVMLGGCEKLSVPTNVDHLQRAHALEEKGDYAGAIIEAKTALQQNPENVGARLLLADAYMNVGNGLEAEVAYKQAVQGGADEQATIVKIGRAVFAQGDYKRVLADVVVSANVTPAQAVDVLLIRGQAQLEMGRFADASKTFGDVLVREPERSEALVGQARIALAGRNYDGATALLQRVFDKSPSNVLALIAYGDISRARSDFEQASTTYKRVLNIDGKNLIALVNLTSLELGLNRLDEAAKHIAVIRQFQGAQAMSTYLQAFLEFKQQNYVAAKESIQKVLAVMPEHLPSLVLAGVNEFLLNSNEQAEKYLRQALSIAPNLVIAKRTLIATLLRSGQVSRAIDLIKTAIQQTPNDPVLLTIAGEAYLQVGDHATAIKYLTKAAGLNPQSADVRTKLGMSRLAAGDNDAALVDLEAATRADDQDYKADMMMIVAYMNRKQYAEASSAVKRLEQKQPANPATYNFKGGVALATRDIPAARAAFEQAMRLDPTFVPAAINLGALDVNEKKPEEAKKRFIGILAKDPKKTEASLALVELDRAIGAPLAEIVVVLNRAIEADPKAIKALVMLSRVLVTTEPTNALQAAKKAFALSPNDLDVLDALGMAQLAGGEERSALATYTKIVELKPDSPTAAFRLASLLSENANPSAAARLLRKALELKPDYLEAQTALVNLELNAGNVAEALKIGRRAQVVAPSSPVGYLLEGDALMASKAPLKAATSYEKALTLRKEGGIAVKIHGAYSEAGKPAIADARLREWLRESPSDFGARYYLATSAQKNGDYRVAIEQYELFLKEKPDSAIVLNDLAIAYEQVNDPRAFATAELAYKLNPSEGAIGDTLGWMLVRQGDAQRGLRVLRDAARAIPDSVDIRMHLAQGLAKTGDKTSARSELERLVSLRGNFSQRADAEKMLAALQADN